MTPCPTIHVFGSATSVESHRFYARYFVPTMPTPAQELRGMQPSERPLPMGFFHPTKDGARAAAEAWWAAEQERIASRKAANAKRKVAA